jgi:mannosylfructose-phosphate synthase
MACGTPTIVTSHGGFRPVITFGREALYADPLDREDLGIMMVKVLGDSRLRARLSRLGASKAKGTYTWSSIAQRLLAVVEHTRLKVWSATMAEGCPN